MSIFLLFFQDASSGLLSILPMFVIFIAIFYFIVLRPQQKQQQQLRDMIAGLKMNDEVVTNGGIIGRIKEIRETSFIIQSAEKTFLEVGKNAIIGVKGTEVKN